MHELQRQAYLQAMGIECYLPRLQLPGALASTVCELPVRVDDAPLHQSPSVSVPAQAATAASAQGGPAVASAAAAQALLGELTATSTTGTARPVPAEPAVEVQAGVDATSNKVPHFSLAIVRGQSLLIVDEGLQGHDNPKEYLHLLQNLVFALGAGKQSLSIDTFAWPMVKNSRVDQGDTAARQALEAFLSKQVQQLQARFILLMGTQAAHYCSAPAKALGVLQALPALAVPAVHTLSVSQLLSAPERKAETWAHLQPVCQLLR